MKKEIPALRNEERGFVFLSILKSLPFIERTCNRW